MEDEDNFKCNLCDKAYRYEGTLKTHIVVKHCKSNSYNCDQCEQNRSSVDVDFTTSEDPASKGIKSDTGRGPYVILKYIVEKSQTNATNVTLHPRMLI